MNFPHTGKHLDALLPPATKSIRLGFCRPRGPTPPVVGRNDLHCLNEAGPHSYDGTSYQRTRTVSHFDTHVRDRIPTIWKCDDGCWRHEMIFQTEHIPNLPHAGEEHLDALLPPRVTGSASAAHEALSMTLSSWERTISMA